MAKSGTKIIRNGVTYTKNKDIFKIKNKWITVENTVIDNYTQERVLKTDKTLYRALTMDGRTVMTSQVITCDGTFLCKSSLNHPDFNRLYHKHLSGDNFYNSQKYLLPVDKNRNRGLYSFNNKQVNISSMQGFKAPDLVDKYSYGFEIETSNGDVDDNILSRYGFTTVYDGSIGGHEIVSKPLTSTDLEGVVKLTELLPYSCSLNSQCSLHIHIGNITRTESNLKRLYDIYYKLQDELWSLIPSYKKEISYLKHLEKDYVKNLVRLPTLSTTNILKFFAIGDDFNDLSKLNNYINNNNKWTLKGRYHFINFLNYICKRNGTIEVRLLQSTFCWKLIYTWLLTNVCIIDYAINNDVTESKQKIFLKDVIEASSLPKPIKDTLLSNIILIKDLYFTAYINRKDFQRDIEEIDRILEARLIPYVDPKKIKSSSVERIIKQYE